MCNQQGNKRQGQKSDGKQNTHVVILAVHYTGANFMNRLKLSQLSLCIRFMTISRLKSVLEIGPSEFYSSLSESEI